MPEHNEKLSDRELATQLRAIPIPAADEGFEERIIQRVMSQGRQVRRMAVQVHRGAAFLAWWNQPRMAIAASIAALVAITFWASPPVSYFAGQKAAEPQVVAQAEDRYTVDGMPLLVDIDVLDEDAYYELAYADLVGYNGY